MDGTFQLGDAMCGFIVLQDGRAYTAANWAYDATLERIAETIPETEEGRALSAWLLEQRCCVQGPGLGGVDLRELAPDNRKLFEASAREAIEAVEHQGPAGWGGRPELYSVWVTRFHDLLRMLESIGRGEPPSMFNPHMTDVVPATGKRAGPGRSEQ